ncbi:hypothetical protein ACFL10_00655 [Patescibacteria group bacterium]
MKEQRIFELFDDEQKRVEFPDVVITTGVDTCVALGIINTRKRIGYLGHFLPLLTLPELLLDDAIEEAENIQELNISIAGSNPHYLFGRNDDALAYIKWLKEMIRVKGIMPRQIISMHLKGEGCYTMSVDTKANKIRTIIEPVDDVREPFTE